MSEIKHRQLLENARLIWLASVARDKKMLFV
jgi:hypothetical protein